MDQVRGKAMFEMFGKSESIVELDVIDRGLINERLSQALIDSGVEPDSKTYFALFKMLTDDLDWYFENTEAP